MLAIFDSDKIDALTLEQILSPLIIIQTSSRGGLEAEIVETTLVVSRFRFLRVGSRISELGVIILPGMQI